MSDKPITVGELIEHLRQFPTDMPVLYIACSDYSPLLAREIVVEQAVPKEGWFMRARKHHIPSMSEENRANVRDFLVFPGN